MKYYFNLVLLTIFLTISCSRNETKVVINKTFPNEEWSRFEYLSGEFNVRDIQQKYDIIMEIRVSDVYPNIYENHREDGSLQFNMTIKYPNNSGNRSRDYKFSLKDREGNWKADKVDGYYVFKLPIINEVSFNEKGIHEFKIENKYPKDPLYGVKDLTLKCVNSK